MEKTLRERLGMHKKEVREFYNEGLQDFLKKYLGERSAQVNGTFFIEEKSGEVVSLKVRDILNLEQLCKLTNTFSIAWEGRGILAGKGKCSHYYSTVTIGSSHRSLHLQQYKVWADFYTGEPLGKAEKVGSLKVKPHFS